MVFCLPRCSGTCPTAYGAVARRNSPPDCFLTRALQVPSDCRTKNKSHTHRTSQFYKCKQSGTCPSADGAVPRENSPPDCFLTRGLQVPSNCRTKNKSHTQDEPVCGFYWCKGYKKDIFGGVLTGFELNEFYMILTTYYFSLLRIIKIQIAERITDKIK